MSRDRMKNLEHTVMRLKRLAETTVKTEFNGKLFEQKTNSLLDAMKRGELPVPLTKGEFRLLMKSVLPGCIS